ncbi:MAG: ABC transporter ATP-binding protein [Actinomycetota bacterium]|nr:ABC transporter ATP-binding protein [Actinomycetota bacterium]
MADPALAANPTVEVNDLSVWFGPKVALSQVRCSFGPGITGLLGPNGAGKTTLMRAIVGLLPPGAGTVRVTGRNPRSDRRTHRMLALVPEEEAVPDTLTARDFVRYVASLHGVRGPDQPEAALAAVDLTDAAGRRLREFSKGMRQRAKVAAALVTNPQVLVLDEPLNGTDPVQRAALIDLFRRLDHEGRTVVASSHILHEVEAMADRVIVLLHGRIAAAGDHRAIRDAMADRPRHVLVRTRRVRELAAALVSLDAVAGLSVDGDLLTVGTSRARELAVALPRLARSVDARLLEVRPLDDSLESLFRELVR